MNKIGIHFGYFNEDWKTDFVKQVEQVKRIGFDILEVAPAPFMDMDKATRSEVKKVAEANDIEFTFSVGLGAEYDLASDDPAIRKNGIDFTIESFKIMEEMGSKMYSGVDIGAWNKTYSYGVKDKSKELNNSIASVKEILNVAEAMDITFAVEVVNRYESALINTAEEAKEYIQAINSPNCKILLDTYHMNIEEDCFTSAIQLAGKDLAHFHVGEANRRPPMPNGRMPWDEITTALKNIDYTGAIVMEPFIKMGGEVGRDIKVWRDISKGASLNDMEQLVKNSVDMLRTKMQR